MIEFIFTLDYEIYGDGTGELRELVYEPMEKLAGVFQKYAARLVVFTEVAELQKIEECGTDDGIDAVRRQVRELHQRGHEIALHLHPQWYNAEFKQGRWALDYSEYNLCTLPAARIGEIADRSLAYLGYLLHDRSFVPLSFRAGNWLFQPTAPAAGILGERGLRIDSSVFKGGLQHAHNLDYRPAREHGDYWSFSSDVNVPDAAGPWLEVPIYSEMVPSWKLATGKRLKTNNGLGLATGSVKKKINRVRDLLRIRYPLKLDFCRMTLSEMTSMMANVIRNDKQDPDTYRPIVTIGHTKDLHDLAAVDSFLAFLRAEQIPVVTFDAVYARLREGVYA